MNQKPPAINLNRVEWLIHYNFQHRRPYASFFEWKNPNNPDLAKKVKERSVARELVKSLEEDSGQVLFKVLRYGEDPPDVVGIEPDGNEVGFEVTELVSLEAIAANSMVRKAMYYRKWTFEEVILHLESIIEEKSAKLSRSPYGRNILVIHTDEPEIRGSYHEYGSALGQYFFRKRCYIDEAYLLFSYRPGRKTYPYLRLNFQ
jgi:hypothetical protein